MSAPILVPSTITLSKNQPKYECSINPCIPSMLANKLYLVAFVLFVFSASNLDSLQAHGSFDELLQHFSQKIFHQPENHSSLLDRARVYLKQGNTALAYNDIQAAAEISDTIEVAYVLGLYHAAENDCQSAVAAFSSYLNRYPYHIPAIHNRAKCHAALGLTAQSVSDYEYLLDTSKQHSPDYYLELARVQSSVETGGIEPALKSLDLGMMELGILVSLQTAAIQYEINRGNYGMAMVRHETLKPWLGKTSQWRLRQKQLSRNLTTEVNKTAPKKSRLP